MKQEIKVNKTFLIAGIVILAISLCVFPFEYNKASYVFDLKFTFLTLTLAMLTLMYSFMGKYFFKGLLFLFGSCIFSISCWFYFSPNNKELSEPTSEFFEITLTILSAFQTISILFMGTVTGIVAGLIFLLINYKFLKAENLYLLFILRLISYLIILVVVSVLFHHGKDWIAEIAEYLKAKL